MNANLKKNIMGALILAILAGCSSQEEADRKEITEEPTHQSGEHHPTEVDKPIKEVQPFSFQDHMKQLKEDKSIKSIDWSEETGRYVYIKETSKETFEIYCGNEKKGTENLVIKHNYSAQNSTVSISPKGTFFLVNQLTSKKENIYKSKLYDTETLKSRLSMNTFGLPIWDEDGNLIRSAEVLTDKYPATYQGRILVSTYSADPLEDKYENIVLGPKNKQKLEVRYHILQVKDHTIYYEKIDLVTGKTENREAIY